MASLRRGDVAGFGDAIRREREIIAEQQQLIKAQNMRRINIRDPFTRDHDRILRCRAAAAALAMSTRRFVLMLVARASPPFRPSSTAALL